MSDLQMALIVLGVALVAAVWLYNRWVERRYRRRIDQAAQPAGAAPQARTTEKTEPGLMPPAPAPRDEPALGTIPEAPQPGFMDADLPLEPEISVLAGAAQVDLPLDVEVEGSGLSVPDEWGDGRVDCLLQMEFVAPVPASVLWEEHREWSEHIDKPIQWLGLDEQTRRWHTLLPQDAGTVKHLAVALQLVDRLGAVGEDTLKRFVDGASRLAQRFVGHVEPPPLADLLERAQELDAFCASVDLQLSLHVLPKSVAHLSGARLKTLIDQHGLRPEGERFVATDASGAEAFALLCRSATAFPIEQVAQMALSDLIFTLDVPRVAAGAQTFDRMIACARQCAATLGGQLADAHRKPLPDATIATIRRRIEELQNRMAERGIPAGGVRALRLFAG